MNAVPVDKVVVDRIVSGMIHYGLTDLLMADALGQVLTDENRRSLIYHDARPAEAAVLYDYKPTAVTAGQVAHALQHYAYNSNEYPGWPTSEARSIIMRLAFAMLVEIPGYHESERT